MTAHTPLCAAPQRHWASCSAALLAQILFQNTPKIAIVNTVRKLKLNFKPSLDTVFSGYLLVLPQIQIS